MTEQPKNNRISSGIAATVTTAAIAVAGVVGYFTINPPGTSDSPPPVVTSSPGSNQAQTPQGNEKTAQIYWLEENGTSFQLVPQPIEVQADINKPSEFLEAAFTGLLDGPTEGSGSSAIPKETKLLGIKAKGDEVRVNLSDDFQFGGGSAGMIGRVGQIVYTATALNTNA